MCGIGEAGLVPTAMGMNLANDIVAAGLAPSVEAAVGDVIGQTPLGRLAAHPLATLPERCSRGPLQKGRQF